jgi:hypothetical protein
MRNGGEDESDTDDDVSSPPTVPSFQPPASPGPTGAPYESEKPPRRMLEPEYEDDDA